MAGDAIGGVQVFEDQFGNTWKHDEGNSWVLADADEEHTPTPDLHEGLRFGGSPLQSIMNLIRHPATLTSLGRSVLILPYNRCQTRP